MGNLQGITPSFTAVKRLKLHLSPTLSTRGGRPPLPYPLWPERSPEEKGRGARMREMTLKKKGEGEMSHPTSYIKGAQKYRYY
jgi:hypothetical protein